MKAKAVPAPGRSKLLSPPYHTLDGGNKRSHSAFFPKPIPEPMHTYTFVVERDPDTSLLVGYVPGFPGAHSQAETLDELQSNMREVIGMLLEDGEPTLEGEFVGTQLVSVSA